MTQCTKALWWVNAVLTFSEPRFRLWEGKSSGGQQREILWNLVVENQKNLISVAKNNQTVLLLCHHPKEYLYIYMAWKDEVQCLHEIITSIFVALDLQVTFSESVSQKLRPEDI